MGVKNLGRAATHKGWRKQVSERAAPVIARKTPARQEQVQAAFGLLFLAMSLLFLAGTLRRYLSS